MVFVSLAAELEVCGSDLRVATLLVECDCGKVLCVDYQPQTRGTLLCETVCVVEQRRPYALTQKMLLDVQRHQFDLHFGIRRTRRRKGEHCIANETVADLRNRHVLERAAHKNGREGGRAEFADHLLRDHLRHALTFVARYGPDAPMDRLLAPADRRNAAHFG